WPSTVTTGPCPQARLNCAVASGAAGRSPARAGTDSRDNPSGSVTGWPNGLSTLACRTFGNDTSIRSVTSGLLNTTRPVGPIAPCRTPAGLVIRTVAGAEAPSCAGSTTMDLMRRLPCQLRWITGWGVVASHPMVSPAVSRLGGSVPGSVLVVAATLTCSTPLPGRAVWSSTESRPAPGTASADALSRRLAGSLVVNVRASGATLTGLARLRGDGTCWWKENPNDGAFFPSGSCAGRSSRVTWMPGISTSEIPAPAPPDTRRLAPVIVIRSELVSPGLTRSCWTPPVAATWVVTLPAAVETRSELAISLAGLSSSMRLPTVAGSRIGWSKLIWFHCPTGVVPPSAHAVAGSSSNTLAGSSCRVSPSHDPYEDTLTCAAPDSSATV